MKTKKPAWLTGIDFDCKWSVSNAPGAEGFLLEVPPLPLCRKEGYPVVPAKAERWLALGRHCPWWVSPFTGGAKTEWPEYEIYFLLWQRADGQYVFALPLVADEWQAHFQGHGHELRLHFKGPPNTDGHARPLPLLVLCTGRDPFALVAGAFQIARERLGSFRLLTEKPAPTFPDYFGWCTWDAFYEKVSARDVRRGLAAFKRGGLVPPLLILDDGWQQGTLDRRLMSLGPVPSKYPGGLASLVADAKAMGVKIFGVWHALQGYWSGISVPSPLAERYHVIETNRVATGQPDPNPVRRGLIPADQIEAFYHDLHSSLQAAGVDMVKVDNQAGLDHFTEDSVPHLATARAYQQALQAHAGLFFRGELIHCMCHKPEIAFNLFAGTVWRNSDDFQPRKPATWQRHVYVNALNNLWSSQFALPDWDMFWSTGSGARYHAAARAISGGPVYVSDRPGRHNFALLRELCITGGRVLRCDRPALPAGDILFTDCRREQRLLKITNRSGTVGMLGLFHCLTAEHAPDQPAITDIFRPADVPELEDGKYAAWFYEGKDLRILRYDQKQTVTLPFLGHELVWLAPIVNGVAALGLLDKMNGPRAIEFAGFESKRSYLARFSDGGKLGFYSARKPRRILANGKAARFSWNKTTGLLILTAPAGLPVDVEMKFGV